MVTYFEKLSVKNFVLLRKADPFYSMNRKVLQIICIYVYVPNSGTLIEGNTRLFVFLGECYVWRSTIERSLYDFFRNEFMCYIKSLFNNCRAIKPTKSMDSKLLLTIRDKYVHKNGNRGAYVVGPSA